MLTKNQIWKYFHDFAQSHLQIGDFGYGDLLEISQSQASRYCLMWVVPIPSEIGQKQVGHRYTILVADREFKDLDNRIEVESDTFQICLDIIAQLDKQQDLWELEHSATITPFKEKFKDEVNGHMFDVILRAPFRYDSCQIPTSGDIPVPPIFCDPALIEINDVFFANVPSGSALNIPVQYRNGMPTGINEDGIIKIDDPIVCSPVTILANGVLIDVEAAGGTAQLLIEGTDSQPTGTVDFNGHMTVADSELSVNGTPFTNIVSEDAFNLSVKNTNNVPTGNKVGNEWIVPAAEDATVKNSDDTYSEDVASGDTLTLPDIIVTDSNGNEYSWPAVKSVSCTPAPSPSGVCYCPPIVPRQYTAYDTNSFDDGGRVQSGFYDYTKPVYPVSYAELDYSVGSNYHFRLKSNNIFGNKFRFTDIDGNQAFPSTNNKDAVFIDHVTGYMCLRNTGVGAIPRSGARNFQTWINTVAALSITVNGVVYDDWFQLGVKEAREIYGNGSTTSNLTDGSNIILFALGGPLALSTTVASSITNFYTMQTDGSIAPRDKTTNGFTTDCLAFRKHLW